MTRGRCRGLRLGSGASHVGAWRAAGGTPATAGQRATPVASGCRRSRWSSPDTARDATTAGHRTKGFSLRTRAREPAAAFAAESASRRNRGATRRPYRVSAKTPVRHERNHTLGHVTTRMCDMPEDARSRFPFDNHARSTSQAPSQSKDCQEFESTLKVVTGEVCSDSVAALLPVISTADTSALITCMTRHRIQPP